MKHHEFHDASAGRRKASDTVTAALLTLQYPITKQEAIRRVGSWEVPYAADVRLPLANLLQGVPVDTFRDAGAAAAAVDRRWGHMAKNLEAVERAEREAQRRGR